ncbi:MAG TPA: hypothetical protein VEH82_10935 [Acidimicrobiales bacterium]|nr:hypothetical protein [Acidimicrobiales bacterium]
MTVWLTKSVRVYWIAMLIALVAAFSRDRWTPTIEDVAKLVPSYESRWCSTGGRGGMVTVNDVGFVTVDEAPIPPRAGQELDGNRLQVARRATGPGEGPALRSPLGRGTFEVFDSQRWALLHVSCSFTTE